MGDNTASRVSTTETSFDIVDALTEQGSMTVEELEAELGLTNSTVHRHLTTLRERGYVVRDGPEHRLGFQFLTVGGALRRTITAYPMIKTQVDTLAAETDERGQFIVRENDERVYLYTETGEHSVQTGAHIGRRGPIHSSAAGKAILANLPEAERERFLSETDLETTGPNTITDPEELRAEFADIRERGYSTNLQESTGGVHAVGAPVTRPNGEVIGALSVSGPATRLKGERLETEIPDAVLAATNELELHIEHA